MTPHTFTSVYWMFSFFGINNEGGAGGEYVCVTFDVKTFRCGRCDDHKMLFSFPHTHIQNFFLHTNTANYFD